jgi:hypothetical protein
VLDTERLAADTLPMQSELAPVRRAQHLLQSGSPVDDVVDDLRRGFGLSVVDAIAAVADYVALTRCGTPVAEEPFARPFV